MKIILNFLLTLIVFTLTQIALAVSPYDNFKKPADNVLRKKLSPLQYQITQQEGTEPPFNNTYWNNSKAGIYVDVVSGEPLFSSLDKYDSKTGWPSFTKPLDPTNIILKSDTHLYSVRTEVVSKHALSHLGHVFNGPVPLFNRYSINSAALEFIPAADLKKRGYGQYLPLFQPAPTQAQLKTNGHKLD